MALSKNHGKIPGNLSRSIQVIGAGYSRTGTVSFALAIEKLLRGPVCHSGSSCLMREEAWTKKWISILSPGPDMDEEHVKETLKDLIAGYVGVTDQPGILFIGELASAFPNAKIICVVRDPEKWWKSMEDILKQVDLWWLKYLFWPMPTLRLYGPWMSGMLARMSVTLGPDMTTIRKEVLERHTEYVKRVVPADRLHFIDLKDGWEPLYKILDCPVPNEPFPHVNDRIVVREAFGRLVKSAFVRWMQLFAASGALIAMGLYALR